MATRNSGRKTLAATNSLLLLSTIGLALAACALVVISKEFVWGVGHLERPIPLMIAILLAAGAAYIGAIMSLDRMESNPAMVAFVVVFSLALGASQLKANPVQESDFYRYLLDGGVTACGDNPYALSPTQQENALATVLNLQSKERERNFLVGPSCLTDDPRWPDIIARVNFPDLRTIYPPLMQYWFAGVVKLGGPSIESLRLSFLLAEAALLTCLVLLLISTDTNPLMAAVFGWSPLVFKEIANSAHYDIVPAALLCLAALALARHLYIPAFAVLALAAGTKLFAVILIPLWLRAVPRERRLAVLAVFAVVLVIPFIPFANAGTAIFEGTSAFATRWTMNDPLFSPAVDWLTTNGLSAGHARGLAAGALLVTILAVSLLYPFGNYESRALAAVSASPIVLAVLLIGGPTANPWYFCWLLPLVAIRANVAWLGLIAMLPLYYGHFYLEYHRIDGRAYTLIITQFMPFAILAIVGLLYRNRSESF